MRPLEVLFLIKSLSVRTLVILATSPIEKFLYCVSTISVLSTVNRVFK